MRHTSSELTRMSILKFCPGLDEHAPRANDMCRASQKRCPNDVVFFSFADGLLIRGIRTKEIMSSDTREGVLGLPRVGPGDGCGKNGLHHARRHGSSKCKRAARAGRENMDAAHDGGIVVRCWTAFCDKGSAS